jgi:hypothetical protein
MAWFRHRRHRWALRTRRTDPKMHKRMMLLATLMLLDAAIARMN